MKHKNAAQNNPSWQWLGFAAIAFFVLIVYSPSLMHAPRADQIMYLTEVGHKKTLWDLTIGCLDLNRHRQFNPGDEVLFRPLAYILLGAEKFFFGYKFLLWQGLGILLHLGVIWCLLRLLLTVFPGWPAIIATAFFAFMFTNMEMVVWHHINSYMVFVIAILVALRYFYGILVSKSIENKKYLAVSLWLLLAAFTHEMGSIAAAGLGLVLWFLKPKERALVAWVWAVPLIYGALSLLDARIHPFTFTKSLPPAFATGIGHTFHNWLYAMGVWTYTGLFPSELQWLFAARNMIAPSEQELLKPLHFNLWPTSLAMCALAGYIWCLLKQKRRRIWDFKKTIGLTSLAFAVVFAAIIAVGRGNQVAMWDVLRVNTYYMYIFWVFLVVGLYAVIDWAQVKVEAKQMLAFFIATLILCNAFKLYPALDKQARENNDILVLVRTMDLLVKEHGQEPDFSFYVDEHYPGNYIYEELRRKDDPLREYSLIEALYPQYFTSQAPKYKFLVK